MKAEGSMITSGEGGRLCNHRYGERKALQPQTVLVKEEGSITDTFGEGGRLYNHRSGEGGRLQLATGLGPYVRRQTDPVIAFIF